MKVYWEVWAEDLYVGMTDSFEVIDKKLDEPEVITKQRWALMKQARDENEGLKFKYILVREEDEEEITTMTVQHSVQHDLP